MGRWVTVLLLAAVGCEDDGTARSYNTGANGTAPTQPTTPNQTSDTWSCDDLCEAVETDDDVLCLIDALTSEGYNLLGAPRCPSWLNYYEIETEDCVICANDLELDDSDCQRYRVRCNL